MDEGKAVDVVLGDFSKAFDTVSEYPSGRNVQHTARQGHNTFGQQLAEGSSSKSYSQQGNIWLVARQ